MMKEMKDFERLATAMKLAMESDADEGTLELEGQAINYRKRPAPGIRLRLEPPVDGAAGGTLRATVYEAASSPPDEYPAELPFLPGYSSAVIGVPAAGGTLSVQWQVNDAKAAAEEIARACEGDGWVRSPEKPKVPLFLPIGLTLLERAGRSRAVLHASMGSKSFVMLLETEKQ
jgi:hypothetical protein